MKNIKIEFGVNLRNARKALNQGEGKSQVDFAADVDLTRPTISRFENGFGNPTLTQIEKLANALNIEPADLLKRD
ncbi:helix-turn-helix domain-containing protein [Planococcus salinarum]|uniref:helix-turn-helix domain-containing protein n=1 Tax=Planococcus salinarum TaxID=622695 RepID=UPI00163DB76A|nr:helix-turn-helix transcriptional regulator [Planococcus salinarum]